MRAGRQLKILVVENDPDWLALVVRAFSDHVVKPVRYYPDAVQIVEAENVVYDVAIIDLNLLDPPAHQARGYHPDLLGGDLLLKLHANHPSTLRVALTGIPSAGSLLRSLMDRYHIDEL